MDTLWLVEDDKVQQFIVKKLVTQTAVVKKLELFNNGEEAYNELLSCISQNKPLPGVILLDINMPVMDAWGFLSRIVTLKNIAVEAIPVVMFTSSVNSTDVERSDTYPNVKGYLIKPCSADSLLACINKLS